MKLLTPGQRRELFSGVTREAARLELRDVYAVEEEQERFAHFMRTGMRDHEAEAALREPWLVQVRRLTAAGVRVRRARVVSEPVTEYIRFEHAGTGLNVQAGEQVRWLPRPRATGILLPANDFWLVDGRTMLINHFGGDGHIAGQELTDDPTVIRLCESAFDTIWAVAIPHDEYRPA